MKKPETIERQIKRLIDKHLLSRIELSSNGRGVSARAVPNNFHPWVEKRRTTAINAKVAEGATSLTVAETDEIMRRALDPVAYGNAIDIASALARLEAELAIDPR